MKKKIWFLLFIVELGVCSSYVISGLLLSYTLVSLMVFTFFYFIAINNKDKKENLNIIKHDNKLYIYLSNDLICTVNINKKISFDEFLKEFVEHKLLGLKGITERVNFINFKNNSLLLEINSKL